MSAYYCYSCDLQKDNDWEEQMPHPWSKGEFVCPDCHATLSYEQEMCAREDYNDDC